MEVGIHLLAGGRGGNPAANRLALVSSISGPGAERRCAFQRGFAVTKEKSKTTSKKTNKEIFKFNIANTERYPTVVQQR